MRLAALLVAWVALAGFAQEPKRPSPARPGTAFQGAQVNALQADDFANPGMLWVDRGAALWEAPPAAGAKSCAGCHGPAAAMKGVAARYPRHDPSLGRVVNLEARIQACQGRQPGVAVSALESPEMLALATFVAHQSRGVPVAVAVTGEAASAYERGRELYFARIGQLNLACTHCHDERWGRTLLAEPISQGHPTGWPAYRLEWQAVGSLHRRLRACFYGVRAEQPAQGGEDLVALELYLADRARGLAIESPGVRR